MCTKSEAPSSREGSTGNKDDMVNKNVNFCDSRSNIYLEALECHMKKRLMNATMNATHTYCDWMRPCEIVEAVIPLPINTEEVAPTRSRERRESDAM